MIKALLIIYFSIGFIYAIFANMALKHPAKMLIWNILIGPVFLVNALIDAIRNKKIKIGD